MQDPTHLFCIGATKAGTTWLHRYLASHPQCHLRGVKELHYFDAVAFGRYDTWTADLMRQHNDARRGGVAAATPARRAEKARIAADALEWAGVLRRGQADDAAYLAYLDRGRCAHHRLVADITPAYSLLPQEMLARMAAIRPDVRFVYLLRDPVERIWSHARMIARRRATDKTDTAEVQMRAVNIVNRILEGGEAEIVQRSDYAGPLARLQAAVDPGRLHVVFHEELFTQAAIDRLCGFLGLDAAPARLDARVLKGPEAVLAPGQRERLRALLAPQYDCVARQFGALPARWATEMESVG